MFRRVSYLGAILKQIKSTNVLSNRHLQIFPQRYIKNLFEPDYLDLGKPETPLYDSLNVQLKGFDYVVLEHFQKFVHNVADNMGIEVEDSWALPAKDFKIHRYKPQSAVVDAEYKMSVYERNVEIVDVPSTSLPILLEVLQATCPEGVTVTVKEHTKEDEEVRYVPDHELLQLKSELENFGSDKKKKSS